MPTSLTVGIGKGAENGILIRSGDALQASEKLDAIILDKTGTITRGEPALTDVVVLLAMARPTCSALRRLWSGDRSTHWERRSSRARWRAISSWQTRKVLPPFPATE